MNDQAREALRRVISNYGPAICQTPRSCELFVRQECGAYPMEARALVEALRHGVTTDLISYQAQRPWGDVVGELRARLQRKAGLAEAEGAWAVDAWARALGRHPESWQSAPQVMAVQSAPTTVSTSTLKTAMTCIVAAGGGLGAAVGAALMPAALLITSAATKLPFMDQPVRSGAKGEVWLIVALVLFVIGLIGGMGGAAGAALGWMYGKGDRAPWQGFTAAFGAAFTSAALGGYFCGIFGWFFGGFISAFGAATAMARRGGWDR